MKKGLCIILVALIGISLVACGAHTREEALDIVVFNDSVLESMIKKAMDKGQGSITYTEAALVTELNLGIQWQQHIPEETQIKDITGLKHFINLTSLDLSFHGITDITPLAELNGLKSLKLQGCPIVDYSPLENIYQKLEEKDFTIAFTLSGLGFLMINDNTMAGYEREELNVTVNHLDWGSPAMDLEGNTVRMAKQMDGGNTLVVLYYPDIQAYVFQIQSENSEFQTNYIYDQPKNEFSFGSSDRESAETAVESVVGYSGAGDVLLSPIPIFNDTIERTFGISADTLYGLPFEKPTLKSIGFVPDMTKAICLYDQHQPHDMHIYIHRPEWGKSSDGYNTDGCNIEFYDDNVNGYSLLILYFADEGRYQIDLFKDQVECTFDSYPDRNEYGQEYPDVDTVYQMLNAAFKLQGEELYYEPLAYFEQLVQNNFGMSIDELYGLQL